MGETSGTKGIPEEVVESLIWALEAIALEEEMEFSIRVSEAVAPEAEASGHKDDMVPTV